MWELQITFIFIINLSYSIFFSIKAFSINKIQEIMKNEVPNVGLVIVLSDKQSKKIQSLQIY